MDSVFKNADKGDENVTNPPRKPLSWMCMGVPVCQECLLPAIFHCAETCTHRDATLSFLSWLSCNTRVSDSSFSQMWSTSLHIKHQNLPLEPGWCTITMQVSTTPPNQIPSPKIKTPSIWCTGWCSDGKYKPFQTSLTYFSSPSLRISYCSPNGLKCNQ